MTEASGGGPPEEGEAPPAADADRADAGEPGAGTEAAAEPDTVVAGPALSVRDVDPREPTLGSGHNIDKTRAGLAIGFLAIFAVTVVAAILIAALSSHEHVSDVNDLLHTLIPAETALLGSAVGFYFGTRSRP
jgi:Na+/H+-translocating membrane pyrophosphatase